MNRSDEIQAHYINNWKIAPTVCYFSDGPIWELPQDFRVLCFPPGEGRRELWTYSTCGMSQPGDIRPIELHLFSPKKSDAIVELLYAVCHFDRTGSRLGLWHTVNFGRPWLEGSLCTYGFVSLPYLDGPNLENLYCGGNAEIKCYWLIPITYDEMKLKVSCGVDALEEQFETKRFNYLDPMRLSVV